MGWCFRKLITSLSSSKATERRLQGSNSSSYSMSELGEYWFGLISFRLYIFFLKINMRECRLNKGDHLLYYERYIKKVKSFLCLLITVSMIRGFEFFDLRLFS